MEYKKIPRNNTEISVLGFGLMRLEEDDEIINLKLAKQIIEYAIANGINYFDTAYAYGDGEGSSEKAIGTIIDELNCRNKVYLSTKMDRTIIESRDDMEEMFTEELDNLKSDYIDYYYIHNVISYQNILDLKEMGLFDFIEDKKQKGQIKNMGFSFHGPYDDFKKVIDEYDWDMTLLQYNYLDTNIQAGIKGIKLASQRKMGVFIMEPLKGGMLADKMPPKASEIIEKSDIQRTNADLALSWVLNTPEVTCVLSGMNQLDMVKENIQIANNYKNNPLTEKELNVIENTKKMLHEIIKIPCTCCDYCLPCPKEIEISEIFDLYNKKYLFPEKRIENLHYADLLYKTDFIDENADGSSCVNCGICQSKCPQQIEIPELLKQIDQEFNEICKEHDQLLNKLIQDDSVIEEIETLYD